MEVKVIDARSTHAALLAWVMLTAFRSHLERGLWDFYVGGSDSECLRFLETLNTTTQSHWAHYSNFIVAEVDGQPASALCGYFEAEQGSPSLLKGIEEANRALGRTEEDNLAGWQRAGSITNCAMGHVPGVWIVENVATLPQFRRRGLVDRLLQETLTRGRDRGATVSQIGVFIGNDPAQRAYEKAGFAVRAEKRDPEFEAVYKCPGVRRLSRTLWRSAVPRGEGRSR